MARPAHDCPLTFFHRRRSKRMLRLCWVSMVLLGVALLTLPAQAQTFTVLHTFTGPDGLSPYAGVTLDGAGNLYGTTYGGGANGMGTVYELKRHNSNYIDYQLHAFTGGADGAQPYGGVTFGPDGLLYGTTMSGGYENSGGVYSLQPPPTICATVSCPWTETVVYNFASYDYGFGPFYGEVAFDPSGNLYGTTAFGGSYGTGSVYQARPSGGGWMGTVIYSFISPDYPAHSVIRDNAGNLYGTTTSEGQFNAGVVFELTPEGGFDWTEHDIASLGAPGTGGLTACGLIRDSAGNLYGGESGDGRNASVFELSPSGSGWQLTVLYIWSFSNDIAQGPVGNLVLDRDGNLYGTTMSLGTFGFGNIFKLSPNGSGWTYTDLYDFQDNGDGAYPTGDLSIDSDGNIYGTNQGDQSGHGVVWKLTP
jgi:uncharacterized repeat protein (TIGR03803 family)